MHTVRFACDCLIKTMDMAISTHFTSYLIFERSHIGPRACRVFFFFHVSFCNYLNQAVLQNKM